MLPWLELLFWGVILIVMVWALDDLGNR